MIAKRVFDIILAAAAIILLGPVLSICAALVLSVEGRPVLYRAPRIGKNGRPFTLYKFRTMRPDAAAGGAITAQVDSRVTHTGTWLRRFKLDELPQLWNVLRGDMTIIGTRPEDPEIMRRHYTAWHLQTLAVPPGLSSPGSIYTYTHLERLLVEGQTEAVYAQQVLPIKLALDLVYIRQHSIRYDVRLIARTVWVIAGMALGSH